ncbi:MAG TPA: hypothetical protein VMT18_09740, partial [Planctomycetota bacterium]|nr:hypothetical protein [Planctomycetota bacterium]
AARLLGLWLAVLALAAPLVPWSHADPTDEVEWTAISILHWQQLTRGVTFAAVGLAGALLMLLARELVAGRAGLACALLALVLWLATPAVREAATFVRGDWFMVAGTLATLLAALRLQPALAGARGERALVRAGALLGLLCGLTVSAKLNGVFVVPLVVLWGALARIGAERVGARSLALSAALFAGATCASFFALHPYLWDGPLTGIEAALERWRWMRMFLREDWSVRAHLITPRNFAEGCSLFLRRLCVDQDPWRALCGIPLRPLLLPLALPAAGAVALRADDGRARSAARLLLVGAVAIGLGTAAWLPIDWPRYWLSALALACLLEARLLLTLAAWLRPHRRAEKPAAPQVR